MEPINLPRHCEGDEPSAQACAASAWKGCTFGPEHAVAQAAVRAVALGASPELSPLILHGPSGVGKTRLLEALVRSRRALDPTGFVAHAGASSWRIFRDRDSLETREGRDLRAGLAAADLVVIDDLHAIADCPVVWNLIAEVLDDLELKGTAFAAAARGAPGAWRKLPARLLDRLGAGLTIPVELPAQDTLRAYLRLIATERGAPLELEAEARILAHCRTYRDINGAISGLGLGLETHPRAVDPDPDCDSSAAGAIEPIIRRVGDHFGIAAQALKSRSRRRKFIAARHLAMYLSRKLTHSSLSAIARAFGGRDASSVRHAIERIRLKLDRDPQFAAAALALEGALGVLVRRQG